MENKVMDKIQRDLIKKYHALAGQLGMTNEDKLALLSQFGVESSRDLSQHQLIDICGSLSNEMDRRYGRESMDALRKRLIKAIGDYLKVVGRASNIAIIKSIACRAAGVEEFNRIPRERLRSLYGAFLNKKKDYLKVDKMCNEYKANRL
ncbi:hypothetical protein [Porphyromonas gingivicanis]|uniref:hypothetical protein n=1 Tax=Porphyromonas gingivicanis TaxID=266762 RepID=UPI000B1F13F0|nr:hypothetical protein [Porphyromonas gingivicanis]